MGAMASSAGGSRKPVHVTVTGAAGQIGYALVFRVASGQLLGPEQPIVLRMLEIEPAMKAGVAVSQVTNMTIWGNHSATQYPDAKNARIGGRPAPEVIKDAAWLGGDFITSVQKRGAAVIEMRGLSSAGSAANAAIDSVVSIRTPTAKGDWHSLAVASRGEYGTPEGLQFGFPVASDGAGWKVVEGLQHDAAAQKRIKATTEELLQERELVKTLVPA